jgi:ATP-dependent protease HslVU (ClpYQ) peptidase subunit
MTTIAYKDGILAADSRETHQNTIISDSAYKLASLRWGKGAVTVTVDMAATGHMHLCRAIMKAIADWYAVSAFSDNAIKEPPCMLEDQPIVAAGDGHATVVVMVTKDNQVRLYDFVWPYRQPARRDESRCWAWGSGMDFALGAMAAGATAFTAVDIAANLDTGSGGLIRASLHTHADDKVHFRDIP